MRRFAITMAAAILLAAGPSFAQTADPQIGQANDQEIAQAIVKNLREHQDAGRLKGFDIDLNVEQGKVTLTGNVTNADQHKLAIDAARFVPGVKLVVNDLKIAGAAAEHPEQQNSLGAGLASFFSRNKEAEPSPNSQSTPTAQARPQAATRSARPTGPSAAANTSENENSHGLLAGLRKAWSPPESEGQQQQTPASQIPQSAPTHSQPSQLVEQSNPPMLTALRTEVPQAETPKTELAPQQPKAEATTTQWEQLQRSPHALARQKTLVGDFDPSPLQTQPSLKVQPVERPQLEESVVSFQRQSLPTFQPNEIIADSDHVQPIATTAPSAPPVAQQVAAAAPQAAPQPAAPRQQPAAQPQPQQRQVRQVRIVPIPVPVAAYPPRSQSPMAYAPSSLPGSPQQAPMQQGQYGQYAQYGPMMAGPQGAPIQLVQAMQPQQVQPAPQFIQGTGGGVIPARYDHPQMPGYAWPSYASYPNYAALQYPQQYSAHAWPYIGPFYPYPQVPLGWRKVTLTWDDGWWQLDFKDKGYGPYVTR